MSYYPKIVKLLDLFLVIFGVAFLKSKFEIKIKVFEKECTIKIFPREKKVKNLNENSNENLNLNETQFQNKENKKTRTKKIK